jgi:hypothetical protein
MGLHDPTLAVTCDFPDCREEEIISLTACARGTYDERNVEGDLREMGWTIVGESCFCSNHTQSEVDEYLG